MFNRFFDKFRSAESDPAEKKLQEKFDAFQKEVGSDEPSENLTSVDAAYGQATSILKSLHPELEDVVNIFTYDDIGEATKHLMGMKNKDALMTSLDAFYRLKEFLKDARYDANSKPVEARPIPSPLASPEQQKEQKTNKVMRAYIAEIERLGSKEDTQRLFEIVKERTALLQQEPKNEDDLEQLRIKIILLHDKLNPTTMTEVTKFDEEAEEGAAFPIGFTYSKLTELTRELLESLE